MKNNAENDKYEFFVDGSDIIVVVVDVPKLSIDMTLSMTSLVNDEMLDISACNISRCIEYYDVTMIVNFSLNFKLHMTS